MQEQQKLKDLESQVVNLPAKAEFISINSQATLDRANEFLDYIKAVEKKADNFFDENIGRLKDAVKEAKRQKEYFLAPLFSARDIVKEEIKKYLINQEQLRLDAERKRQEEEEKKFEKAREAERLGFEKAAEKIRGEKTGKELAMPDKVVSRGSHLRKYWTYEIEEPNKVPREFCIPDKLKIGEEVRNKKGKTNIPGVRVFQETTLAKR